MSGPANNGATLGANPQVKGCMWASTLASHLSGRQPKVGQGQNRTREIRPSGIAGRLAETWLLWAPD
jgi:hypothetical protein